MENKTSDVKQSISSLLIFLVTIAVVIVTLIPVVFPALLLRTMGGSDDLTGINPFELGVWAYPFLITNSVIFVFGVLYIKKRLPKLVTKQVRSVIDFEMSSQQAFIVIAILLGAYVIFSAGELYNDYFDADFFTRIQSHLENFSFTNFGPTYVQDSLLVISMILFGNYKIISFVSSVALLVVTYLLTKQITKKRFPGIISMGIVLISGIFLHYDASVAYPNFWILFYLVSLYVVLRAGMLSPISHVIGILSKPLVVSFLPMSLFFVYRSAIAKKEKIKIAISYGVIAVIAILGLFVLKNYSTEYDLTELNAHDFWGGFTAFNSSFQHDGFILIFLLPVTVGLFVSSRQGIRHADSFMFLIMGVLLSASILPGVSIITNTAYRFIPLVIFFAIGAGIILSKRNNTN